MNASEPTAERELVVTREFDVPARFLFEAYSRPEHLKRWFGPKGYPLTLCEVDFRVGGRFRFAMTGPDGKQNTPFGGEYLEIVPDRKIVFDNSFEEPNPRKMIMTVTFEEAGGKTRLVMHTLFESRAMRDEYVGVGMEEGINSGFDQLAGVVAELRRRSER
ncbi:MAG: SRPBCC domain-containing protein [Parvibaculaceae bacterium]